MEKGKIFIILLIVLSANSFTQTYINQGNVSGNWVTTKSPYLIQGDITVPNDSTLTIEPGVSIVFQGHYGLFVQGRLLAVGTEINNINFTVNDTTGFYNYDTTLGGWYGIRFINTPEGNDTSKIIYCNIQYGKAVGHEGGAIYISNFDKVLISSSTISHNSAGGIDSPSGGGISLHFADITLSDNEISYNRASDGGGILIWESDPVFNNNVIEFNTASQAGGGVWIGGISNANFSGDIISNNSTDGNGGGVICWQTTKTEFDSVNIINNIGHYGGGANFNDCDVQINNCKITDNSSAWIGGGIHAYSCNLEINNTSFERDTAFVFGGAMGIYFSELTINNSNLINNSARNLGGGIHSDGSNINISKTLFNRDTTAGSGGAVFNWLCQAQFNNCDFIENSALNGGAISSSNSDLLIDSSSFFKT